MKKKKFHTLDCARVCKLFITIDITGNIRERKKHTAMFALMIRSSSTKKNQQNFYLLEYLCSVDLYARVDLKQIYELFNYIVKLCFFFGLSICKQILNGCSNKLFANYLIDIFYTHIIYTIYF